MILGEKILQLRKKNGWSQEDLAEKCQVSRQSISKWEVGGSIPDINNIMLMSQLFGVSTDYLLKDDIEMEEYIEEDVSVSSIRKVSLEDANRFMELKENGANKLAGAVALCILSPVIMMVLFCYAELKQISEEVAAGGGVILLLGIVAVAVAIFIMHDHMLKDYEYLQKVAIELEYGVDGIVTKKEQAYNHTYGLNMAIGVILCILSAVPIFIAMIMRTKDAYFLIAVAALLIIVAIGVYLIVKCNEIKGCYDQLLQQGDYTVKNKEAEHTVGKIASIYWPIIVAIYLGYSFVTNEWDKSWIIWPVAGVAFGAIASICKIIKGASVD